MKIFIGADHKGFHLKEKLKPWLKKDHEVYDVGNLVHDPKDNYTDFAQKVAQKVLLDKESRGILLCGSGVGIDIAANKFDGIRASIGVSPKQVQEGRSDDNMNILVIPANFTHEHQAKELIKTFLETKFDHAARHERRLREIKKFEHNN